MRHFMLLYRFEHNIPRRFKNCFFLSVFLLFEYLGETAKSFDMMMNVEFVRSSLYMSTLLTGPKLTREAAHPNLGLMFDFYHFWSGLNRLEDMDQIRPGEIQHVHFQDVPDMPREMLARPAGSSPVMACHR